MTSPWLAILYALFVWWFSTGTIMLVVRWADRGDGAAHRRAVLLALPMLALGVLATGVSLWMPTFLGAYLGFTGALAIWGWIEMAFLAGIVTGPLRDDCPPGLNGLARFQRGWSTVAHHELLLTVGLLGLVLASTGAENKVALMAYLILYFARIFAKLNLFFGVPRINTEFVPARLQHLKSYFRRGPVTFAFPMAITALTTAFAALIARVIEAQTDEATVAYALLIALAGLALVEHWLMVVPLPDAKLWRWMLPAPKTMTQAERQTHGL
ncbi:MAG: DUF3623 family protein [Limimaricola sp.]|uniref:putative photosynthetic complex assembly protein PuhE n=1 Tax=Limimaricola sp. TaxID=2211665 RepID=UPI001E0B5592|nr:putative photosynthetic complex assembly protein PuhE [Limimaricola sp.]MBI1417136.1 DUF3623 family protein [Limimaricola sp.]